MASRHFIRFGSDIRIRVLAAEQGCHVNCIQADLNKLLSAVAYWNRKQLRLTEKSVDMKLLTRDTRLPF